MVSAITAGRFTYKQVINHDFFVVCEGLTKHM